MMSIVASSQEIFTCGFQDVGLGIVGFRLNLNLNCLTKSEKMDKAVILTSSSDSCRHMVKIFLKLDKVKID